MSNEQAKQIIQRYAWLHACAAFVAGQLGGQFGLDRIPLTILTIKMIIDLCRVYKVTDTKAQAIHVGTAIGRLTLKGTLIAHTILNWVPIVGPGANAVTTFFLTKNAGNDCVNDIQHGWMNSDQQAMKALKTGFTLVAQAFVGKASEKVGTRIIEDLVNATDGLTANSEIVSTGIVILHDFMQDKMITDAGKAFVSAWILSSTDQFLNRKEVDIKESLLRAFGSAVASVAYDAQGKSFVLSSDDEKRFDQLLYTQTKAGPVFSVFINAQIDNFTQAIQTQSTEQKRLALEGIQDVIGEAAELFKEQMEKEISMTNPIRVLIFGTTGTGKTSLCNELHGSIKRPTSDSVRGVTFETYEYSPFTEENNSYILTDTVGLNESNAGTTPAGDALIKLLRLLKQSKNGYNLLVHVIRAGRITQTEHANYDLFVKTITNNKVPVILAVTGCENIEPMSKWAEQNRSELQKMGLSDYKAMICTCFAANGRFRYDDLRIESRKALMSAFLEHSTSTPQLLYKGDHSMIRLAKRTWNRFGDFVGVPQWKSAINKKIKVLLERLGLSQIEAEKEAKDF